MNDHPVITLSWSELSLAANVGMMRRIYSLRDALDKNKHALKSDWQTDIDGAAAEMAFAKYLGIYYVPTVNTFKRPDVAGFQVRSTKHSNGHLIIRSNDTIDSEIFILVTTCAPFFTIVGAMKCIEAKAPQFFKPSNSQAEADAWWVPQSSLNEIPNPLIAIS